MTERTPIVFGPSPGQAAAPDLLATLEEVADYLDRYADVIDGDDGQPEANDAMRLLVAVTDVIAKAK